MPRRLCCCGLMEFGSVDAVLRLRHMIEEHGVVPTRTPRVGDPVYPRPEYADPCWYRLAKTRRPVRCHGCHRLIEPGQLHASQRYCRTHYCVQCVGFAFGTPDACTEVHQHIKHVFNER